MAIHAFAQAHFAVFRDEFGLVVLRDEIVQIVIGFEDHVAATPAIAAAGAAFGTILLARESHAASATVTRARVNFYLVDKHKNHSPTDCNTLARRPGETQKPASFSKRSNKVLTLAIN